MILDSSAIVAILFDEAEAAPFAHAIRRADAVAVAAPTLVESAMVAEGRAMPGMADKLDALLGAIRPEIVAFTAEHARIACDGWRRFGKGRHPAGLNFGDCMVYAVAMVEGAPLLFTGEDFARTDVAVAGGGG